MRGKLFKFKWLLIGGALLMAAVTVWVVFFYRPAPDLPPLPTPNGYGFFVKAGKELSEAAASYYEVETNSIAQLGALIAANSESRRLLSEGVQLNAGVPFYGIDDADWIGSVMGMKHLARLQASEARLARLKGATNEAAQIAIKIVEFGQASARGGPMIHYLVGIACSGQGFVQLKRVIPGLTSAQCRDVMRRLKQLGENQETAEAVIDAERAWMQYNHGHKGSFALMWEKRSLRPFEQFRVQTQGKRDQFIRWIEEARILVAAQAHLMEKGSVPASVEALAPNYLRSVPIDPETGKPMALPE